MARVGIAEDRRSSTLYETDEWVGVEDWLTVLSGFVTVVFVLYLFFVEVPVALPTYRWATDGEFAATVAANQVALEKLVKDAETKGEPEVAKAAKGLQAAIAAGERAEIGAAAKKLGAAANVILGAHHRVPPVRGHPLPGPRHRLA